MRQKRPAQNPSSVAALKKSRKSNRRILKTSAASYRQNYLWETIIRASSTDWECVKSKLLNIDHTYTCLCNYCQISGKVTLYNLFDVNNSTELHAKPIIYCTPPKAYSRCQWQVGIGGLFALWKEDHLCTVSHIRHDCRLTNTSIRVVHFTRPPVTSFLSFNNWTGSVWRAECKKWLSHVKFRIVNHVLYEIPE